MLQYWTNKDGEQSGPFSYDELKQQPLDSDTWVWCSGMDDWKKIVDVPELAALAQQSAAEPQEPAEPEPEVTEVQQPAEPEAAQEPEEEQVPEQAEQPVETATPPAYEEPMPQYEQQPAYEQPQSQYVQQPQYATQPMPECPPTNLVWAIISTVLCCVPLGIVAIVLAANVKSKYEQGDYARAKKYSDWSAWCCIAAITLGVIGIPVSLLTALA